MDVRPAYNPVRPAYNPVRPAPNPVLPFIGGANCNDAICACCCSINHYWCIMQYCENGFMDCSSNSLRVSFNQKSNHNRLPTSRLFDTRQSHPNRRPAMTLGGKLSRGIQSVSRFAKNVSRGLRRLLIKPTRKHQCAAKVNQVCKIPQASHNDWMRGWTKYQL